MTSYDLEAIISLLDRHRQRATYGAVAKYLGVAAQGVMQGLPRTPRYSWVVNAELEYPTGYDPAALHPELFANGGVIDTGEMLAEWLEAMG